MFYTVNLGNSLPQEAVKAGSLVRFKNGLDKFKYRSVRSY